MFQHAQEYCRLWGAMVGKQTGVAIVRRIQGILEKIVGREIASLAPRGSSPSVPPAVITRYVVNSMLGLLIWWLDERSRYSAEEVDRMFRVLIKPGIAAALRSTLGWCGPACKRRQVYRQAYGWESRPDLPLTAKLTANMTDICGQGHMTMECARRRSNSTGR